MPQAGQKKKIRKNIERQEMAGQGAHALPRVTHGSYTRLELRMENQGQDRVMAERGRFAAFLHRCEAEQGRSRV